MHLPRSARLSLLQVFLTITAGCMPNATRTLAAPVNPITPPHLLALPPAYPTDFAAKTTNAGLLVQCTITEEGVATACISLTLSPNPIARDAAFRWLAESSTRFAPGTQEGRPISTPHKMSIRFSYDPKVTPSQKSYVGEWPNPFPSYPPQYQEAKRVGSVTYHFTVASNGLPIDAHVDAIEGGDEFGASVLSWLSSGCVHFRPDFQNGAPLATPFPAQTLRFALGN